MGIHVILAPLVVEEEGIRHYGEINMDRRGFFGFLKFIASWNEPMLLKDGDMIVTSDGKEVYRIARKEFGETYA